jgi:putative ABC transport system permease protein
MAPSTSPPRLANCLLRAALEDDDFEAVSGDLEEAFRGDVVPRLGPARARVWYWRQAMSIVGRQMVRYVHDAEDVAPRRHHMGALRQDLGYAVRTLLRQPVFTVVATLTLALGIGANVAIFSLVTAVLFKPLPFGEPDRLMAVHLLKPERDNPEIFGRVVWSYPKYDRFRANQRIFESIALHTSNEWNLTGSQTAERLLGEHVEASYLTTLGIRPLIGRDFTGEETRTPGSAPIAILGDGLWRRRFGADPTVIGRTIGLDGVAYTIVGVLPPGFRGLSGQAEILVPVMTRPAEELNEIWNHSYSVVARRNRDVAVDQSDAASRVLGSEVSTYFDASKANPGERQAVWTATAVPLDDERVDPLLRRSMLIMLAAVGSVLLIVCVNLANLLLVRALARQHEVAIRLALGASRGRIVRLLMTENALLAVLGGLAGVAVASVAIAAGAALLPDLQLVLPESTGGLTRVGLHTLGPDWRTLMFALALIAATAVLFGLGPAWRASRRDLTTNIKASGSAAGADGRRYLPVRQMLIVVEVALALVLLSAGGLMLKSVVKLQATELGFTPNNLISARLVMAPEQYDYPRARRLLVSLIDRLGASPLIEAVGYNYCAPLSDRCNGTTAKFPGRPQPPNTPAPFVNVHWASPGYFGTLGIRVVDGRSFTADDTEGRPKVVVINERAARTFWPGASAIGQRIAVGQGGFGDGAEVVGIVADVRYRGVERSPGNDVYLPLLQSGRRGGMIFVRTRAPAAQVVPIIRAELRALDPDIPLADVKTMGTRFGDATWRTRTSAWLLGTFSMLALVLATVGIYGVVSQSVAQRARELGVRVALGATRRDILHLVLGRASAFAAAGVVLGIALAIPATRLLTSLLYQVQPGDPLVLATLAATLLAVALLASYLPARRATRVSPLTVLRGE